MARSGTVAPVIRADLRGDRTQAVTPREKLMMLESLQLEAEAGRNILDHFLKSHEAAQAMASAIWPDAVLVSPAVIPLYPAPPGKTLLLIGVLVFSICAALAAALIQESKTRGLKHFDDIRSHAQKPLGILPTSAHPVHSARTHESSNFREALKRIYMSGFMHSGRRCLLITSALPKEGRTVLTCALAHYLLSLGHKVLAVDADFLRPALSRIYGKHNGPGLADVLAGHKTLADAIGRDASGLAILGAGNNKDITPDMLQSDKLKALLDELKSRFDFVLVDAGPLTAHTEAAAFAHACDGVVVVAEWLKTSQKNLANLFSSLEHYNAAIVGVVLNKVDIGKYKALSESSDFLLPRPANAA